MRMTGARRTRPRGKPGDSIRVALQGSPDHVPNAGGRPFFRGLRREPFFGLAPRIEDFGRGARIANPDFRFHRRALSYPAAYAARLAVGYAAAMTMNSFSGTSAAISAATSAPRRRM